ncbi:hypothetical protein EAD89_08715 [Micromonospora sp. BL4]|nr:hypothetical protein EAD89_08715 [Micromonospora sp. BL4]
MRDTVTFVVALDDAQEGRPADKGIFGRGGDQLSVREVPLQALRNNITETVRQLRELFVDVITDVESLPLREVQVGFEVTATGKIALVGTSVETSGKGAITLTFGR